MVAVLQVNPKEGFTLEEAFDYVGGEGHFWDLVGSGLIKHMRMEGKGRNIVYKRVMDAAVDRHIAGEPVRKISQAEAKKLKAQWRSDDD